MKTNEEGENIEKTIQSKEKERYNEREKKKIKQHDETRDCYI